LNSSAGKSVKFRDAKAQSTLPAQERDIWNLPELSPDTSGRKRTFSKIFQ
jgi:hypothetical protein